MGIDEIDVKDTGDILRLIRNIYHTIVRVNLTTNNHRCIQTNRELVRKNFEQLPSLRDWTKFCIREGLVYADDVDEFRGFLDQDRIRQALNQGKEYMSLAFRRIFFGNYRWEMMEIIAGQDYRDDNHVIILCIRDIDEERQRELDKEAKLSAQERQLVGEKTVLVVDDAEIQRVYDSYPVIWKNPDAKAKLCFMGCPHMTLKQLNDNTDRVCEMLKANGLQKVVIPTVWTASPGVIREFKKTKKYWEMLNAGVILSYICPLMYMNNPLCKKKAVITSSNKLRTYTSARFYQEAEIQDIITGKESK